ncbi:TPA: hypothetical protein TY888_000228 [Streptococcus suis]|nr:hypothetical protein [Streptococcus suis]
MERTNHAFEEEVGELQAQYKKEMMETEARIDRLHREKQNYYSQSRVTEEKIGYSLGTIFDDAAGPIARSANDAIRASYTGAINTVGDAIGSTVFGATIGSVIGMAQGDSPGQAIASSVMTTTFSYGLTQVAMLGAAAFLGATPVGWAAIGIGVAAGAVTSLLYNSDFMGMKSVAQDWGENMDETFSNIRTAFKNVGDFLWGG